MQLLLDIESESARLADTTFCVAAADIPSPIVHSVNLAAAGLPAIPPKVMGRLALLMNHSSDSFIGTIICLVDVQIKIL